METRQHHRYLRSIDDQRQHQYSHCARSRKDVVDKLGSQLREIPSQRWSGPIEGATLDSSKKMRYALLAILEVSVAAVDDQSKPPALTWDGLP